MIAIVLGSSFQDFWIALALRLRVESQKEVVFIAERRAVSVVLKKKGWNGLIIDVDDFLLFDESPLAFYLLIGRK